MLRISPSLTSLLLVTTSCGLLPLFGPRSLPPAHGETAAPAQPSPQQLFEDRIMPIFRSPKPSSCTQCHLSGLDLKDYILPSHEKTFLSLRDNGLIDLDRPDESKILRLIQRGAHDDDTGAALIHAKVRKAEYEAFAAWIKASATDPRLRAAPRLESAEVEQEDPLFVAQVKAAAKTDKVLESFVKNVWAERKRCDHCHMPGGKDNAKWVAKYGERVSWMKREGPAATMRYLTESKLIDTKQPEKSLLVLKPLVEVEHVGGRKLLKTDPAYKNYIAWLTEYAASAKK